MPNSPLASLKTDGLTSRDKLDLSFELHSSFTSSSSGLSLEEIRCDEVDDILPKTDYTYSKTGSYGAKYLKRKRYSSPNMSRRKVRGPKPAFMSDDEEEFEDDGFREEIMESYESRSYYQQQGETGDMEDFTSSEQGSETGSVRGRRSRARARNIVYTSTPHQQHHISTHDHYYDGMLLRSGHKIEGVKWHMDEDGMVYQYDDTGTALLPTPIGHSSQLDMSKLRGALTTNNTTTTKITTTTTTTTTSSDSQRQLRQRGRKSLKEADDEMSERKLRLDETETEKGEKKKGQYVLKHLYGLDSDDISDVDDVDFGRSSKAAVHYGSTQNHLSEARFSFFTYITTIITTVVTTITTTITESSAASGLKSAAVMASKPVVVPAGWLLRRMAQFFSWLIIRSASLLLLEVDMKQRRRRAGCCCWLFPLLLLLPFVLLAAYYWQSLAEASHLSQVTQLTGSVGSSLYSGLWDGLSATKGAVASSWASLWLWLTAWSASSSHTPTPVNPLPKPVAAPAENTAPGVDLDQLHLFIQQTVEQTWQVKGNHFQQQLQQIQVPAGMTREEVEAIVAAALAGEMATIKGGMDGVSADLKTLLQAQSAMLEARIAGLEAEIKQAAQEQQVLVGNLDQTKATFEGISADEKAQLAATSAALEAKLADLSATVGQLSSQNAALTALVGNCCRNNSLLADTVRAQVFSILAEMGADEDGPLSGVLGQLSSQYVDKPELDRRLEETSVLVQERVMAALMAKMEQEKRDSERQMEEREKDRATEMHIHAGQIAGIDEAMVKSIVDEALIQFSADRVGLPDFALESAGGSVLSVRCSQTYYRKTALVSIFGLPLWYTSNSPRTVIQPNVHPGECWAFKGQSGYIVLQLSHPVQVTGFTLEHIPRSLAPRGDISSAPYKFAVFGLTSESDTQGLNLGNYTYEDNASSIQHYDVQNRHPGVFQLIELRVLTNHGNPEYTCIYRFRVHGLP